MSSPLTNISERTVMANVGLDQADLERRKKNVGLGPDDLTNLAAIRDVIHNNADLLVDAFFGQLSGQEEAKVLLGYKELTGQVRQLKKQHVLDMVSGKYDLAYAEARIKLGLVFVRVGLETKVFVGAFARLLAKAGELIMGAFPTDGFEMLTSLNKVSFFDIGLYTDVLIHERQRLISRQSDAIRELSTPVLQIRERLLLLPLIGVIDTHRAKLITENLLAAVRASRAKVVVIDVTGVATIDTKVANHLVQTVNAARLMGARTIISGVSAEVAQSMVSLGVELTPFRTVGDLQGGVETAEEMLGYHVVKAD